MVNSFIKPHASTGIQAEDHKLTPANPHDAKFSSLWHPHDFIQAPAPISGQKPTWERVTDHPLEPRSLIAKWYSPNQLIGVTFANTTPYCLLDIDSGSQYHPQTSPEAFRLVLSSLEDIGLVRPLIVQSSDSEGVHVYFPLAGPVKTFALANLLVTTLEEAGLKVTPGQLETFPNLKTWKPKGQGFSLYKAHRLPLQQGSYLLDQDGNSYGNSLEQFLHQWEQAGAHQDQQTLEEVIATTKTRKFTPVNQPRSRKAEDWYRQDQVIIAQGFTGSGQTNALIKKVGEFGRVFVGEVELAGEALLQYMIDTIKNCPGYQKFCRHKHEIEKRCRHWLPLIEKKYYHYRSHPPRPCVGLTNEERGQAAQERIKAAINELERQGKLPTGTRKRYEAIIPYGISLNTLYKHKELWHPEHYQPCVSSLPQTASADPVELTKSPNPSPNQLIHTPLLRSLAQPVEVSSDPEIYTFFHQPPRRDPSTEIAVQTGSSTHPTETQTSPPALNQEPALDPSVPTSLSKKQPSPDEQAEFNEWFSLAQQFGIVIDSEIEDGEIWVLTTTGGWEPWTEVSAIFTPLRLRGFIELKLE